MSIDFLAVGNITHDRTAEGFRLGGTVSYAAVTVQRLGGRPAILTRASLSDVTGILQAQAPAVNNHHGEAPAEIKVHVLDSPVSTTFTNIYLEGRRVQLIEAVADPIWPADLPAEWANPAAVLLGPIAGELPDAWAHVFPHSLVGVSAQGWLRTWDAAGHVQPARWESAGEFLHSAHILFISREDVAGDDEYLGWLARQVRIMIVTDGWRGSTVYEGHATYQVPPRAAQEVDPTGAGDVFASAFMVRFAETGDPLRAARFANVVASFSVEGLGMDAIPQRTEVEAWLADQTAGA